MKARSSFLGLVACGVVLFFSVSASAVTYTNATQYAAWTNRSSWGSPDFTTGDGGNPDTNRASTIIVLRLSNSGSHTNDYSIVVLNQLLQSNHRTIVLNGGGTLLFTNSGATLPALSNYGTASLTLNEALNVATTTILRASSSGAITVNSNIFGVGSLVISNTGSASVTLAGNNSYAGGTRVAAGTLQAASASALGTGAVSVASGGVLQFKMGTTSTNNSGPISGDGLVDFNSGSAVLHLITSNRYSGGTLISGSGRVALGHDFALGTGPVTFTASAGKLSSTGSATRTLANDFVLSNDVTLGLSSGDTGLLILNGRMDLGGGSRQLSISSPVTLAGSISNGGLIKAGASTLTLSGANSFSGVLGITAGQLALVHSAAVQNATVSNAVANGLALNHAATSWTFGGLAGSADFGLTNANGDAITLTVGGNSANTAFGGVLSLGSLIKNGAGILTLSNAASRLVAIGVSNGTLKLGAGLTSVDGVTVGAGAVFDPGGQSVTGSVTIASGGWMAASAGQGAVPATITGVVTNHGTIQLISDRGGNREWGGLVNDGTLALAFSDSTTQIGASAPGSISLNLGGTVAVTNLLNQAARLGLYYNGGPVLTNFGSIVLYGVSTNTSSGSTRITVGGDLFDNRGGSNLLVNAAGGRMDLISQGGTNSGFPSYTTAADLASFLRNEGTMTVSGSNFSRILGDGGDGVSTNAGTIEIQGSGGLDFYNYSSSKRHSLMNVSSGAITIQSNANLRVLSVSAAQNSGSAGSLRNEGTLTNLGTLTTFFNFTNAAGGAVVSRGVISTSVVNQGAMTFLGGTSRVEAGTLVSSGTLDFQSGAVLSLAGPLLNEGMWRGSGTILAGAATNTGTLSPGHSSGALEFSGDLTLGGSSTLNIELGGTSTANYDRLLVGGALTLSGTLNVTLINGYTPNAGDVVDILNWREIFGAFSEIHLPSAEWSADNLYVNGTLLYAIPEPGMAWALSLGIGIALGIRVYASWSLKPANP
ncbi:MAG: autotransporter-associated beta strand repeat-containing protein [Verrucomicrobiae bacterium]|nr:autotransporter-associated beta strand repeat-containing protein [Verrucomicrobiae bacterium]